MTKLSHLTAASLKTLPNGNIHALMPSEEQLPNSPRRPEKTHNVPFVCARPGTSNKNNVERWGLARTEYDDYDEREIRRWLKMLPGHELEEFRSSYQLGSLIAHRRRAIGMTQAHLAFAANVGRRLVSEVEAGKATAQIRQLFRICSVLRIDLLARIDA